MHTLSHIPGPTLCGFFGIFEVDHGDPTTDALGLTITPSRVGGVLLPFRCPRCGEAPRALSDSAEREKYRDRRPGRDNYHCPLCGCRFKIDLRGTPLPEALPPRAAVAPSLVTWPGGSRWQDRPGLLARVLGEGLDYGALARSVR